MLCARYVDGPSKGKCGCGESQADTSASLVSDESSLQRAAADRGCPTALLGFYVKLEDEESRDELGSDPASRAREVSSCLNLDHAVVVADI